MATKSLTDVPETNHDAMEAFANHHVASLDREPVHEPIPGEYDRGTLTHRETGAIGGRFNGEDTRAGHLEESMDEQTRHDRLLEGGGDR
jgi:hypothetical protein